MGSTGAGAFAGSADEPDPPSRAGDAFLASPERPSEEDVFCPLTDELSSSSHTLSSLEQEFPRREHAKLDDIYECCLYWET